MNRWVYKSSVCVLLCDNQWLGAAPSTVHCFTQRTPVNAEPASHVDLNLPFLPNVDRHCYTMLECIGTTVPSWVPSLYATASSPDMCAVCRGYTGHNYRRSRDHICHTYLGQLGCRADLAKLAHLYRPVGLTPSGTGCLASGYISMSQPKQSGDTSGVSAICSCVTIPYLATGNRSQKLLSQ